MTMPQSPEIQTPGEPIGEPMPGTPIDEPMEVPEPKEPDYRAPGSEEPPMTAPREDPEADPDV